MSRPLALMLAVIAAACTQPADTPSTVATTVAPSFSSPTTEAEPETTTTTTPVTSSKLETVEPGSIEGPVGFVGCSMSQNAVEGYEAQGGTKMWSHRVPYGGGSIGRWVDDITSDRGRYWSGFADMLERHPDTRVIWLNLCTIRENRADSVEAARALVAEIREAIPGAVIFVSGQPPYSDGHTCDLAGSGGPAMMAEIASELVTDGLALTGPIMGPLAESDTKDGCHAGETGLTLLGRQLLEFFG